MTRRSILVGIMVVALSALVWARDQHAPVLQTDAEITTTEVLSMQSPVPDAALAFENIQQQQYTADIGFEALRAAPAQDPVPRGVASESARLEATLSTRSGIDYERRSETAADQGFALWIPEVVLAQPEPEGEEGESSPDDEAAAKRLVVNLTTYAGIAGIVVFLLGILKASFPVWMKGKEKIGVIVLNVAVGAASKGLGLGFADVMWIAHIIVLATGNAIVSGGIHDKFSNPVLALIGSLKKSSKKTGDETG